MVIGAGAVGSATAIEALRAGLRVTVVEPGEPGAPQATSYGNAGWLSSHSVVPPALPGAWRKVPGWLADPLGPLAVRWPYLPRALPWLLRYLASGATEARVQRIADALRTLLVDAPALHARLAAEAGVSQLIEQRGLLHAYRSRAEFEGDALAWRVRARTGVQWSEWDVDELRRREPDLDARYTLGIHVGEAGHCRDPGAYVAALAAHARALGAERVAARATGFRIEGGRLRAVRTEVGEIACDTAAVCAGARSGALAAAAGSPVPLESERGYHVVLPKAAVGPRTPVMVADGKLIAHWMNGGLRAAGQVEIAGLEAAPDWRRAEILHEHLRSMFPALADAPPEGPRCSAGSAIARACPAACPASAPPPAAPTWCWPSAMGTWGCAARRAPGGWRRRRWRGWRRRSRWRRSIRGASGRSAVRRQSDEEGQPVGSRR